MFTKEEERLVATVIMNGGFENCFRALACQVVARILLDSQFCIAMANFVAELEQRDAPQFPLRQHGNRRARLRRILGLRGDNVQQEIAVLTEHLHRWSRDELIVQIRNPWRKITHSMVMQEA